MFCFTLLYTLTGVSNIQYESYGERQMLLATQYVPNLIAAQTVLNRLLVLGCYWPP